jgi:hypothetical protein
MTTLLAAALAAIHAWAAERCPSAPAPDETTMESKIRAGEQARCVKAAMEKDLDAVILPLQKQDPAAFRAWMQLQASFNRFAASACALSEEVAWTDLESGERSDGTARESFRISCELLLFGLRGHFARELARDGGASLPTFYGSLKEAARENRSWLDDTLARVKKNLAAERARGEDADAPRPDADWSSLAAELANVRKSPAELAKRQCALWPKKPEKCESLLSDAFFAAVVIRPPE